MNRSLEFDKGKNLLETIENHIDISILLPIYGDAPYLEMTLESIKIQEISRFEVVMVLDRPSAKQIQRANELASNFMHFKVLISPSSGISHALNFGLKHCQGNYVARIDSDDEMVLNRIEIQRKFLEMHSDYSCVGTQIVKIDHKGQNVGKSKYPTSEFWVRRVLPLRNCVAHPSTMYRRVEVLRVGGYRPQFDGAEDYDLWLRMVGTGKICNLTQPLTRYRIWDGQNSNEYKVRKLSEAKVVSSFSRLEEKSPELAKNLLSRELSIRDFRAQVNEILLQEYPSLWLLQEFKYTVNCELASRGEGSRLKLLLRLFCKLLNYCCRAVQLAIFRSNQESRNHD